MSNYYDLEGKSITAEEWTELYSARGRTGDGYSSPAQDFSRIALTQKDGVTVSTVWLGIDHSFGTGVPLIFETMVFGGEFDQDMDRYATKEEALAGHEAMCQKIWGLVPE